LEDLDYSQIASKPTLRVPADFNKNYQSYFHKTRCQSLGRDTRNMTQPSRRLLSKNSSYFLKSRLSARRASQNSIADSTILADDSIERVIKMNDGDLDRHISRKVQV